MGSRSEVVKARVTESEKKEFKEYIENTNEFSSLSQLLRATALSRINSGDDDATASVDTDEIKSAVDDSVSNLGTELEEISNRLADVEEAVQTNDDIGKLASDIYEELLILDERIDESIEDIGDLDEGRVKYSGQETQASLSGKPEAFADLFGYEEERVKQALTRAYKMYPDVEYVTTRDNTRRYYRDER